MRRTFLLCILLVIVEGQNYYEWLRRQQHVGPATLVQPTRPFHRPDYPLSPLPTTPTGRQMLNWDMYYGKPMQVVNRNPTPIYLNKFNDVAPTPNPYVVYNRPREPQTGVQNYPIHWNYTQGNPAFPNKGMLPNQLAIMPYFNTYVGPEPKLPSPIGLGSHQLRPPPATFDGYDRNRFFYNKYENLAKIPGLAQRWQWDPKKDLENNNRFNRPW